MSKPLSLAAHTASVLRKWVGETGCVRRARVMKAFADCFSELVYVQAAGRRPPCRGFLLLFRGASSGSPAGRHLPGRRILQLPNPNFDSSGTTDTFVEPFLFYCRHGAAHAADISAAPGPDLGSFGRRIVDQPEKRVRAVVRGHVLTKIHPSAHSVAIKSQICWQKFEKVERLLATGPASFLRFLGNAVTRRHDAT